MIEYNTKRQAQAVGGDVVRIDRIYGPIYRLFGVEVCIVKVGRDRGYVLAPI